MSMACMTTGIVSGPCVVGAKFHRDEFRTACGRSEFSAHPVLVTFFGTSNHNPIDISLHKRVVLDKKKGKHVSKSNVVGVLGDFQVLKKFRTHTVGTIDGWG